MCISCGSPLLVVADKHVDERRSDYRDYDRYSRNYHALFPLFLIHFVCCAMAYSKVNHASCTSNWSDYQQHIGEIIEQCFCSRHRF